MGKWCPFQRVAQLQTITESITQPLPFLEYQALWFIYDHNVNFPEHFKPSIKNHRLECWDWKTECVTCDTIFSIVFCCDFFFIWFWLWLFFIWCYLLCPIMNAGEVHLPLSGAAPRRRVLCSPNQWELHRHLFIPEAIPHQQAAALWRTQGQIFSRSVPRVGRWDRNTAFHLSTTEPSEVKQWSWHNVDCCVSTKQFYCIVKKIVDKKLCVT